MSDRFADTVRFYGLLDRLTKRIHGPRLLQDCHGRMSWPQRGVYFFYETGENRTWSGSGARVVRIGTHALNDGSTSTLWSRLRGHRGRVKSGTGNHRGSIFRLLVGIALAKRDNLPLATSWDVSGDPAKAAKQLGIAKAATLENEADLEAHVSGSICQMPFLWLNVNDDPGPSSERGFIERNTIALLSGYISSASDRPSSRWLGRWSDRKRVRLSGLWNNNHVEEAYDPTFLDVMERRIESTHPN